MKNYFLISLVSFIFLFLANSLNAIPIADDFCNFFSSQKSGSWAYAADYYMAWSGRFLTIFAMGLNSKILPLEHFNIISFFLSACFLIFLYQCSKLITIDSNSRINKFIVFSFLAAITWFAYRQVLGRIVIWYSGGMVYILWYVLIPFFFNEFIKCFKDKTFSPLLLFLSILLANSVELIPPALIFFMLGYVLVEGEFTKRESFRYLFILCLIVTLASVPLFLAPGNFVRAKTLNSGSHLGFLSLLNSYVDVARVYLDSAMNTLLVTLPLGVFSSLLLDPTTIKKRRNIGYCFLISALGSALPMGFASAHNGARPASLFVFLFSFGVFALLSSLEIKPRLDKYKEIIPAAFLIIVSIFISSDVLRGIKLRAHFIERDLHLKSLANSNKDITVSSYKGKAPRSLNNHDLYPDPRHWINNCVAKHYKLKSIRLED